MSALDKQAAMDALKAKGWLDPDEPPGPYHLIPPLKFWSIISGRSFHVYDAERLQSLIEELKETEPLPDPLSVAEQHRGYAVHYRIDVESAGLRYFDTMEEALREAAHLASDPGYSEVFAFRVLARGPR